MESRPFPVRQTSTLHKGRTSVAGARYFITSVTQGRSPWLARPKGQGAALAALSSWHREAGNRVLAATVMPDHVHVLFDLGASLTVGQTIARWKVETRRSIRYAEDFQRDFWEHQLHSADEMEEYALYIFLNPYRAGLLGPGMTWPGWWAPEPELFRFSAALDACGAPPTEWIGWPEDRFAGLAHGE